MFSFYMAVHNQFELNQKFIDLLARKGLDPAIFNDLPYYLAPISEHAAWAFRHIFSRPYPKANNAKTQGIARFHHGMQHACRAAIYVPIFANLYRKYQDNEALLLTQNDIKLLQIAALLHDIARENDGEDLWDDESGTFIYFYLKKLGVENKKVIFLAEAVANKDRHEDGYHELIIQDGEIVWKVTAHRQKNIFQKLIHDVDCIEVSRVRNYFDAGQLDFHQTIASRLPGSAFEEQSQLIIEAKSVHAIQGDSPKHRQAEIKLSYEKEDGFSKIAASFANKRYYVLPKFYQNGILLDLLELAKPLLPKLVFDQNAGWSEDNVIAAMYKGQLFARGVGLPSAINEKELTQLDGSKIQETKAQVENRKFSRRKGVATTSSKENRTEKQGNLHRSCQMLAYGAGVFANAGYLFFPEIDLITSISVINIYSGYQKKSSFNPPALTLQEKEEKLIQLLHHLKMGGSSESYYEFPANHNEITYHFEKVGAIYYTNDPTAKNMIDRRKASPFHEHSPILQAIYLQKEYEKSYGITLPLFQYSGLHHFIQRTREDEYSDEKILAMWVKMCSDYMKPLFSNLDNLIQFSIDSIDNIKIRAMYGMSNTQKFYPGDSSYPSHLQEKISKAIEEEKMKLANDTSRITQLIFFAAIGDVANFEKLAPSINRFTCDWNDNSYTMIMTAVIVNDQRAILKVIIDEPIQAKKYLLAKSSLNGRSPLHHAFLSGRLDIIPLLLAAGADVNAIDNDDCTLLHLAINGRHIAIMKALLINTTVINQTNKDGKTPLMLAIEMNQIEIIELLLENGAELHTLYKVSSDLLLNNINALLAQSGKVKLESILVTPLHWAAFLGRLEIVKKLIAKGAVVSESLQGISPHDCARAGSHEKLEILLLLHDTGKLKKLAETYHMSLFKKITAEDEIEKVVENVEIIQTILLNYNYFHTIEHIIREYIKKTGKPVNAHGCKINLSHYTHSAVFRDDLSTGKIIGYKQDKLGRYIVKPFHLTNNSDLKNDHQFAEKDFTQFNLDRCTINKFPLKNSNWYFHADDHVTFNTCQMDGFNVMPGSDMRNVEIINPIFSNHADAEKLAHLYQHIPIFLIDSKYVDILNQVIMQGKKLDLGNYHVMKRMKEMIEKNEIELFTLVIKQIHSDADNVNHLTSLLICAIQTGNSLPFMEIIFQYNLNLNQRIDGESLFDWALYKKNLTAAHLLLRNGADAMELICKKDLFNKLYYLFQDKFPLPDFDSQPFTKKIKKFSMHINHEMRLFYCLTGNLIYIFSHLNEKTMHATQVSDIYQLLYQLHMVYLNYLSNYDVTMALGELKQQQISFLNKLEHNQWHLNGLNYLDFSLKNRFASCVWNKTYAGGVTKVLRLVDKHLTDDDISTLCQYLVDHPDIEKLTLKRNALTIEGVRLLMQIPTIKKLNLAANPIDDNSALLLRQSTTIKKLDIRYNDGITLYGAKALISNLHFNKLKFSIKENSPEEKAHWEELTQEENPIKKVNYGRDIGLSSPVPSLQHIAFFAITQRAQENKVFHTKVKQFFDKAGQKTLLVSTGLNIKKLI